MRYFVNYDDRDNLARTKDEALALAQIFMKYGDKELDARVYHLHGDGRASLVAQLRWSESELTVWQK